MEEQLTSAQENLIERDQIYEHVGSQLRAHRVGRGMTQVQVARLIDISPQQYQKYEDAHSKCSLTYLAKLATHYGIALNEFLPEDYVEPSQIDEAGLLARLVSAYSSLDNPTQKQRLVHLVESMRNEQSR